MSDSSSVPAGRRDGNVQFFDLSAQHAGLRDELLAAMARVLDSSRFILGEEVDAFEREIAAFLGVRHAIGVSSGTDALLASLMALGVGPGDEVITTPLSFVATAAVVARLGARPVFVDVAHGGFEIDPARVAAAVGAATRAIVPVHLFGRGADVTPYLDAGAPVVEDAAQALGASLGGAAAGARGALGCFSFFPTKNLGALGDGGLVVTADDGLARVVRSLRAQGQVERHHAARVGGNFRLDALQAAVLRVKLPRVDTWTERRRAHAETYRALLAAAGVATSADEASRGRGVSLPDGGPGRHVYNQFVVRTSRRDELRAALGARGIGTEVYYPRPLHLHEAFARLGHGHGDFPHAEAAAREALALPIFPELDEAAIALVCGAITEHFLGAR